MMLLRTNCCKRLWVHSWSLAKQSSRSVFTKVKPPNKFPYPTSRRPSPHQIFHLPINATESDIKARYFDLVRIYHPDKVDCSISADEAHARFQSITAAYETLRGKTPPGQSPLATSAQDSRYPTTAAWRATMRTRREDLYTGNDERWKDRLILGGLVATVIILVAQIFTTRRQALAEAVVRTRQMKAYKQREKDSASLEDNDPDRRLGGE